MWASRGRKIEKNKTFTLFVTFPLTSLNTNIAINNKLFLDLKTGQHENRILSLLLGVRLFF